MLRCFSLFHLMVVTASAFNSLSYTFKRKSAGKPYGRSPVGGKQSSKLRAYIFSAPDDNLDCSYGLSGSYFVDDEETSRTTPTLASTDFIDFINREAAALARLAVAYSPADRTINIKNIYQVKLLNLHDTHIDIEVIVCDDMACVSLAVPVSFPCNCCDKSKNQAEFEYCVIDNLGELDKQATEAIDKLSEAERKEESEIESFRNSFGKPLL